MAYGDGGDLIPLLRRAVTSIADFSSRSRRTEVVYYWLASSLFAFAISLAADPWLDWKGELIFLWIVQTLLAIPMFALFARRLHDQDRSAWWATLLPVVVAMNMARKTWIMVADPRELFSNERSIFDVMAWIGLPLGLAFLALMFWPGTNGANRFGDDPRTGPE